MATTWQDRVPTYPNRYKITKSNGSTELVTLERADEPTVVGTPINATNMNALETAVSSAKEKADNAWLLQGGTAIENGADINSFTEAGNYYCGTNVIAASLKNCPVTIAFEMKVIKSSGVGNYRKQIITPFNTTACRYERYLNTDGSGNVTTKGDWMQIPYISQLGTQVTYSLSGTTLTITTK